MNKIYITLLFIIQSVLCAVDRVDLKCLVCQRVIEEIQTEVNKLNPNVMIDAGGYRLDDKGNVKTKTVPQTKSEIQISDIMDTICEKKMEDYIRATSKEDGKLMLIKIVDSNGKMNSQMGEVDVIQDGDLNKSVGSICEVLLEEHEDYIINNFINSSTNIIQKVCKTESKYCSEDYHEEL